jgi:hypothetical protein
MTLGVVFLASTAIINGATSLRDVMKTVKSGFLPAMRVCRFLETLCDMLNLLPDILGCFSSVHDGCSEACPSRGAQFDTKDD